MRVTPGRLLQTVAAAHLTLGLVTDRATWAAVLRDGVVGAVPDSGPRATATWFLLAAPLTWLTGRSLHRADVDGDLPTQRSTASVVTVVGVVGVVLMPRSGFWAVAVTGLWALGRARGRGQGRTAR